MKKTFKIGESCAGGIIKVSTNGNNNGLLIVNCDFTTNAQIGVRLFRWPLDLFNIELYLNDLTTSCYATKIIDYIKEKTK
jgi:hypothetical protein